MLDATLATIRHCINQRNSFEQSQQIMTTPSAEFVTIVSGLPRSGTSMMMRMLEAGGMPVITDGIRRADEDNPRGYYEFEPVKRTKEDPSWLQAAPGKAVKMVYMLLYDLPPNYSYRVVFMRRKLDEVLASQRTMLSRRGKADATDEDEKMAELFRNQLQKFETWIRKQPNFAMHEISYNDLLADPLPHVEQLTRFLDDRLDPLAMTQVVDASLYRNRC